MRVFVYLLVLAGLVAQARAAENGKPAIVFVRKLTSVELFDQLSYPARIVSKVNTTLLAEADGVVSKIHASLGAPVARKAKVLQIRHTDPVYQYAPVTVLSPVAGVVSSVDVTEGTQVTRGQRVATITDPAQIRFVVEVPSPDLSLVAPGSTGEFRLGPGAEPVAVRVTGVSPFVDPATGTASCELELAKAARGKLVLRPGQAGQVEFKVGLHQGFSIPDHAIVYKGAATFVRVVEEEKARQVAVKLGRKQRGQVEVVEGLKAGMQMVERSSRYVGDGEKVVVDTGADAR
ncbi:MAG TPA: efflux RND transporter periplasmic adaptor subunit [Bdellovibrionota bacterium]|nr:efflux RND transporter periplasmic adaptor subunit [Bdellovibrionota bacterium]